MMKLPLTLIYMYTHTGGYQNLVHERIIPFRYFPVFYPEAIATIFCSALKRNPNFYRK